MNKDHGQGKRPGTRPTEADIEALVDGQWDADPAARAALEDAIAADPALRDRADVLRWQNERLRDALGPLVDRPVPDRFYAMLEPRETGRAWRTFATAAAMAGLLLAGGATGWMGARYANDAPRSTDPVVAFLEDGNVFEQAALLTAESSPQAMKPALGGLLPTPDLAGMGLTERDRSVTQVAGQPALAIEYATADDERVTLLVQKRRSVSGDSSVTLVEQDDLSASIWTGETVIYALVSKKGDDHLADLTARLRARINGDTVPPQEAPQNPPQYVTDMPAPSLVPDRRDQVVSPLRQDMLPAPDPALERNIPAVTLPGSTPEAQNL